MRAREIMVRAHELARTMEGDYSARLALGLRQAWLEARLIAAGGKLWEKNGMRRIYINNLVELYGLELTHYNTGNISSAKLDGEKISNSSARDLANSLGWGKLWFDLNKGRFGSKDLSDRQVGKLIERANKAA